MRLGAHLMLSEQQKWKFCGTLSRVNLLRLARSSYSKLGRSQFSGHSSYPQFIPKAMALSTTEVLGAGARLKYRLVQAFKHYVNRKE